MSTVIPQGRPPALSTIAMEAFPVALEARYLLGPQQPSTAEYGLEVAALFGAAALNTRNARDAFQQDDKLTGVIAGGLALAQVIGGAFNANLLLTGGEHGRQKDSPAAQARGFVATAALAAGQRFVHRRLGLVPTSEKGHRYPEETALFPIL